MVTEWNAVVAGSVLCLIFSWFLGVVGRSQGVQFGVIGPIVGVVGALVLTGLAIAGPLHNVESYDSKIKEIISMHTTQINADLANLKHRSLMVRAIQKLGPRPDRNHLPFEHPDGVLVWVTKEKYRKLKKEKKED